MKTKVFIITVLFFTFCFPLNCFANPISLWDSPEYLAATIMEALVASSVVDFVVLWIGYLIIRRLNVYEGWTFFKYFILVVIGGFIIDVVAAVFPIMLINIYFEEPYIEPVIICLTAGVLLYFYNSCLSKKFFKLENYQARVIGVVMAILTNPVIAAKLLEMVLK